MIVQPRLFLINALVASCCIALTGCDKSSPTTPLAAQPKAPPAPTPVIDSIHQVWIEIGGKTPFETAYVFPIRANLEFDPKAPSGTEAALTKWLEEHQAQMQKLDTISREHLEQLPEWDPDPAVPPENSPRFWIVGMKSCLLADASRLYQNKDYNGAATRIATLIRFGAQLVSQNSKSSSLAGGAMLSQACSKLDAMVAAGGMTEVSGKEIRTALAPIDTNDPTGNIRAWPINAKNQLAAYRAELSGSDAGKKLAKQLEDYGATTPQPTTMPAEGLDRAFAMLPRKEGIERARKLSSRQIAKLFDEAESLIEPISQALAARDDAAITTLGNRLLADDTQVMRLVLGDGIGLLQVNQTFTDAVNKGIAAAARMGP